MRFRWMALPVCFYLFFALGYWRTRGQSAPADEARTVPALAEVEETFASPPAPGKFHSPSRLHSLRGLSRRPEREQLPLYRKILANPAESWVIRRQALRSALALGPELTESERDELIRMSPPRILASAALSDSELLEEIVQHAKK